MRLVAITFILFRSALSQTSSRSECVVLGETIGACDPNDSDSITKCDGYLISATEGQTCEPNVCSLQQPSILTSRLRVVSHPFVGVASPTTLRLPNLDLMESE